MCGTVWSDSRGVTVAIFLINASRSQIAEFDARQKRDSLGTRLTYLSLRSSSAVAVSDGPVAFATYRFTYARCTCAPFDTLMANHYSSTGDDSKWRVRRRVTYRRHEVSEFLVRVFLKRNGTFTKSPREGEDKKHAISRHVEANIRSRRRLLRETHPRPGRRSASGRNLSNRLKTARAPLGEYAFHTKCTVSKSLSTYASPSKPRSSVWRLVHRRKSSRS